jgi:hypothetical protein
MFPARVGPVWFPQKVSRDTLHRTCVFISGAMCGSRSAFRCVRAVKSRHSTPKHVTPNLCFSILWDLCVTQCILVHLGSNKSMYYFSCLGGTGTGSRKSVSGHVTPNFCFLHPMRYVGHVVHASASGSQNVDAVFFMLWGSVAVSIKIPPGNITPNMCFCIRWDLRFPWCILVGPRRKTSTFYFSSSGGTDTHSPKSTSGHIMPTLCFLHPVGSVGLIVQFPQKMHRETLRRTCVFCIQWDMRAT